MAQKRNPTSLRLQTRLQGHEKRFASCWFTDYFISQAYTNDFINRLYMGHLLEKGGGWYGESSESNLPETCVSLQLLYRRCFISLVALDGRKQEHVSLNSSKNTNFGRESGNVTPTNVLCSASSSLQNCVFQTQESHFNKAKQILVRQMEDLTYRSIANFFLQDRKNTRARLKSGNASLFWRTYLKDFFVNGFNPARVTTSFGKEKGISEINISHSKILQEQISSTNLAYVSTYGSFLAQITSNREWKDWLYRILPSQHRCVSNLASISTIESICNVCFVKEQGFCKSGVSEDKYKNLLLEETEPLEKRTVHEKNVPPFTLNQEVSMSCKSFAFAGITSLTKEDKTERQTLLTLDKNKELKNTLVLFSRDSRITMSQAPSSFWNCLTFIRTTSTFQSVEFCLHLVTLLYKKRLAFSLVKDSLFKMLIASERVKGVRLVCSGRQGGRSKSAMRAKKQSAIWGQTALSLFSSKLAFSSASIDTSFGQVGVKLWICYK